MLKDWGGFALCIKNEGYEASLEIRKIYRVVPDPKGEAKSLVWIVDESGEDYLFPADYFVAIQVPAEATAAFDRSG